MVPLTIPVLNLGPECQNGTINYFGPKFGPGLPEVSGQVKWYDVGPDP